MRLGDIVKAATEQLGIEQCAPCRKRQQWLNDLTGGHVLDAVDEQMTLNAVSRASFPATEIGLLTRDEYLERLNPGEKQHPSEAYDFDLKKMNYEPSWVIGSNGQHDERRMVVEQMYGGYRVINQGKVVGVLHDGVMYYDKSHLRHRLPTYVWGTPRGGHQPEHIDLPVTSYKEVKYLSEVMPLVSPVADLNRAAYPTVLQQITTGGELFAVCTTEKPGPRETIVILNRDGLIVAQAADEWGATLITVAREYRGKGLSKIIGRFWYATNPSYTSGGFTPAGESAAVARWRERVEELKAGGLYSALVREGGLPLERVKAIQASVVDPWRDYRGERPKPSPPRSATGEILVYADDVTFVVYDRAFLDEPDERFIHGFGFFRAQPRIGTFIYRIEYDRPFAELTTKVALQMARLNNEQLYIGEGWRDLLEWEGIPGVVQKGDYLEVTQELLPLRAMSRKERRVRGAVDPYREKHDLLLDTAESKWS